MRPSRMAGSLRWAFNFGEWAPSQQEWLLGAQSIQAEEKERIGKFVFKKDSKASMAGRLLLRKAISETLRMPYKDIKLARTEKGKPFISSAIPSAFQNFSFNVSHQGEFTVLATNLRGPVGVDVMNIERPRGSQTVSEYFDLMRSQFTDYEWKTIKRPSSDWEKLAMFHRHWCLKESYVKALGVGIGFELKRVEFHLGCGGGLRAGEITRDTQVYVDGALEDDWLFQETMLDQIHCVAVAVKKSCDIDHKGQDSVEKPATVAAPAESASVKGQLSEDERTSGESGSFTILSIAELLSGAEPQVGSQPDLAYWETFNARDERPRLTRK